jgi:DNA primase large subunit
VDRTFWSRGFTEGDVLSVEDLRQSPMMSHLLDALEEGKDIGHYGRLTFAMISRYFVDNEELVRLLAQDGDADEEKVRALVQQVEEKGYNPPRRERILQWQEQQDFPICPTPDDPDSCNVYNELEIPDRVYQDIEEYREEKS